jgi:hypothetical protein
MPAQTAVEILRWSTEGKRLMKIGTDLDVAGYIQQL